MLDPKSFDELISSMEKRVIRSKELIKKADELLRNNEIELKKLRKLTGIGLIILILMSSCTTTKRISTVYYKYNVYRTQQTTVIDGKSITVTMRQDTIPVDTIWLSKR